LKVRREENFRVDRGDKSFTLASYTTILAQQQWLPFSTPDIWSPEALRRGRTTGPGSIKLLFINIPL
jgi:hypothetical protein